MAKFIISVSLALLLAVGVFGAPVTNGNGELNDLETADSFYGLPGYGPEYGFYPPYGLQVPYPIYGGYFGYPGFHPGFIPGYYY